MPASAAHIGAQEGTFEPQFQNNWRLEIYGLDNDDRDIIVLSLRSSELPKWSRNTIVIPYGNEERKVQGRQVYEDIPLVVNDWVDADIRGAMHRWDLQHFDPATGRKGKARDYKKRGSLFIECADESQERSYALTGLAPQNFDAGTVTNESDDVVQMNFNLTVDVAAYVGELA